MGNAERGAETRARILVEARHEFAELGIAGARVDRIAASAGVSKQRIYDHFGDKVGLFRRVLASAFEELSTHVPVPHTVEQLREYGARVYDYHAQHPELTRLLAWESLAFGFGAVPGEDDRRRYYSDKVTRLAQMIPGLSRQDAAALLLTILSIASYPNLMSPLTRFLYERAPGAMEHRQDIRQEVVRVTRHLVDEALGCPAGSEQPTASVDLKH